jgi:hypothetical protein
MGSEGCLSRPQWVLGGEKVVATVLHRPGVWLVDRAAAVQLLPPFDEQPEPLSGEGSEVSVSLDGNYLFYSGREPSALSPSQQFAYIYDLAAEAIVARAEWDVLMGVWSPVQPQIAFILRNGSLQVQYILTGRVQEFDTGNRGYAQQAAWSPDGSQLAYWTLVDKDYTLWLTLLDGEPQALFQAQALGGEEWNPDYWYDLRPRWSPDGKSLAFVAIREAKPEAFLISLP